MVSGRGSFLSGSLDQLRRTCSSAHHPLHRHGQRRRTRMSQVLLRRCIQSSCTVRYHRRWLTQQAVLRSVPDTLRESASGSEPASSTAQPASTPTASSSNCPPTSSRKGRPKVDVFLASLQSSGSQPSLKDLERGRPREHAHPESTLYAKQYNGLIEQLGRSFTKEQLRRFGEQYQLDPRLWRSKKRKVDYARAIVENAWGWPSLRDIEKAKREKTEVLTESKQIFHHPAVGCLTFHSAFNVSRSQLFLVLGKGVCLGELVGSRVETKAPKMVRTYFDSRTISLSGYLRSQNLLHSRYKA